MRHGSFTCPDLTERQLQVAFLVAQSHSNKQIAKELGIAQTVVGEHLSKIFMALGLKCRTQLVVWMLKRALITLDEIELPIREEVRD